MKKALVLTIAALALSTNAFAQRAGSRDSRPRGLERAAVERDMKTRAAHAAPQAHAAEGKLELTKKITSSGLKISSQASRELEKLSGAQKAQAEKLISAAGKNEALATTGLNLLSLIGDAKGDTPAAKENLISAIDAVESAIDWKNDPKAQENVKVFASELAENLAQGKKIETALENARVELKKQKGVDLKIEDLKKLCKKA